jgi:hypothetical protein
MSKRYYTRELRAALAEGAEIVCSLAPYAGAGVVYAPRSSHGDPLPWLLDFNNFRYSGRECHAVYTSPHPSLAASTTAAASGVSR